MGSRPSMYGVRAECKIRKIIIPPYHTVHLNIYHKKYIKIFKEPLCYGSQLSNQPQGFDILSQIPDKICHCEKDLFYVLFWPVKKNCIFSLAH